ncbi:MAG TPA: YfiR family protein [Usitatibacter sp.]|nr:YfiR family protein [Usitatibacter sp.]
MTRCRTRAVLLWVALVVAQAAMAEAAPAPRVEASEAAVKAAFLYKFATYVEWPESAFPAPESPFVFGVAGSDDVAAELEKILPGRVIHNRPAAVRRLKEGEPIAGVHLLFVGRTQPNALAVVRAAQQQGILCVTETERGLETGSTINFVAADERVGFEVSLDAAERSGLRISSRMLNVARRVVSRP